MLRRVLNIASVLCLVACVALMGMWVRSYWRDDGLTLGVTDKCGFIVGSMHGIVTLTYVSNIGEEANLSKWYVGSYLPGESFWLPQEEMKSAVAGFLIRSYSDHGFLVAAPHWFFIALVSMAAAVLYLKPRYRLSTIFVATTILAVVLGMIAWLDRTWSGK